LNDKSKSKTGDMEDLYSRIPNSPNRTEKKEDDPEKMERDNYIGKDLVEHLSN
jgi:hypothetical protein